MNNKKKIAKVFWQINCFCKNSNIILNKTIMKLNFWYLSSKSFALKFKGKTKFCKKNFKKSHCKLEEKFFNNRFLQRGKW